jgi:predicted nucleic acid-binding protein
VGGLAALTFVCLDTSFLIDFLRGNEDARTTYLTLKTQGYRFATTTIVAFELFRGIDKRRRQKREEQAVYKLLTQLVVWYLDVEAAEHASRIYTGLENSGKPIGVNDCLTAAIALTNSCHKIISSDIHFKTVPGLEFISY